MIACLDRKIINNKEIQKISVLIVIEQVKPGVKENGYLGTDLHVSLKIFLKTPTFH